MTFARFHSAAHSQRDIVKASRPSSNATSTGRQVIDGVLRLLVAAAIWPLAPVVVHAQAAQPDTAFAQDAAQPGLEARGLASGFGTLAQPDGPPPTPRHTGLRALVKDLIDDFAHLPSKENLVWTAVGGGLALAVHPADDAVNRGLVGSDFAHDFFTLGDILGRMPTLLGTSGAVYVVGRLSDQPKVSHLGMDLIEALAVSGALTQTLKHLTHRDRPDGSDQVSFPSGHSAGTFAFATALERHLGWRGAVPAYIFSSYVAMSRLPADKHWLSDVVFGAAVGIIAGRTVTRHGREFPVTLTVVPGGVAVLYHPR